MNLYGEDLFFLKDDLEQMEGLKKIDLERDSSGVYFLIRDGVVVYIGWSHNVFSRVKKHLTNCIDFDEAYWINMPIKDSILMERELINKYNPEFNVVNTFRNMGARNRRKLRQSRYDDHIKIRPGLDVRKIMREAYQAAGK